MEQHVVARPYPLRFPPATSGSACSSRPVGKGGDGSDAVVSTARVADRSRGVPSSHQDCGLVQVLVLVLVLVLVSLSKPRLKGMLGS